MTVLNEIQCKDIDWILVLTECGYAYFDVRLMIQTLRPDWYSDKALRQVLLRS
jgi:hypothetical protein